jgi:hypothetical protein
VKHCEAIDMDVTPTGAVFKGDRWPAEIKVERTLLDYLPGPHVTFGRGGVLRFSALNGYAVYRRLEDVVGGWTYRVVEHWTYHVVEHSLKAGAKAGPAAEPSLSRASKFYRRGQNGPRVEAFQWLPHAVPPVQLPDWFLSCDFQHVAAEGKLVLRNPARQPLVVVDGNFVLYEGGKVFPLPAKAFVEQYHEDN